MNQICRLYLLLAVIGAILPMTQFIPWIQAEGWSLSPFIQALFTTLPAAGFTIDLVLTSITFWVFVYSEQRALNVKLFGSVAVNLLIGLSCALPLYLYLRIREN